ncbi:MAG TPA: GAF domain-containing SpoIIE family protein phosphatase, partial [Syntrophobacteria bacterium]|nr:GAF domain-containing SpoIIE family protein phosphatase [Syntrophobacteria bacterium]
VKVSRRLRHLIEANHSLADMESLEELLPRLLELAKDVTGAEASSVMLYNPRRNLLEFASIRDEVVGDNVAEVLKSKVELRMGEGIAGWVAAHREPVIVADVQSDPRFFRGADKKTGFVTQNLLCVPLVHRQELLGVISVLNAKDKRCFDAEDQELLVSFANLAAVAIIRSRLLETRIKEERLEAKLEAAAKIQALFWPRLPGELGVGSKVWAVSIPATFVGGDLYDVIPLPDGSWLVYVGDVSDKGLPAALLMASLSTKIRSEALLHQDVDRLLESVNNSMVDLMAEEGFFATLALGRYWPGTGRLEMSLAGHPPPLWIVGDHLGPMPELRGLSLGIASGVRYEKKEIRLAPGESVVFLTDGVTEAENERKELFGQQRLLEYARDGMGPPWGAGLLEMVNAWRGGGETSDDITLLEIWRDRG